MAGSKSAGGVRVNLKTIRGPLDVVDNQLTKTLKKGGLTRQAKTEITHLRVCLRNIRRQLAAECCDNAWFCDF